MSVEARLRKRLGRHSRAAAAAAVEDDRSVLGNRAGLRGQVVHLDVARARDVARLVLVVATDVDHLGLAGLRELRHVGGIDLEPGDRDFFDWSRLGHRAAA